MQITRKISDDIVYVGVGDKRLARFENLFPLPSGVTYNSYLILDDKVALMDTADSDVTDQFIDNIETALEGRTIDYLVVHHMEPDHGANIKRLLDRYPQMKVVGNTKIETMIHQFFDVDLTDRMVTVKEGDSLPLGKHELTFVMAPMVHWPEVMVSYDKTTKTLFSADAFGTFGDLDGALFNDEVDFPEDYLDEARRYYANIVGKYGMQTQALLKKAAGLEIEMIAPLHGPVWRSNLEYFIDKYQTWSSYEPEEKGVLILVGSIYGHTHRAADKLAAALKEEGVSKVKMYDVSKTDVSYLISEIFKYSHVVLACATYNNGIFPKMANFIHDCQALCVQNRQVAIIENGSWAPASGKLIREELAKMKKMEVLEPQVTIKSSLKKEQEEELCQLAKVFAQSLKEGE
ncbi:FprA family A-type flavoprotein [Lachnospiraceae bacterium OttesenSCG-928-J05]|nr:FprA family A-type flavoprotein [Lachnospiraceae bacterium OttesenSCG-928-J05]